MHATGVPSWWKTNRELEREQLHISLASELNGKTLEKDDKSFPGNNAQRAGQPEVSTTQ